LQSKVIENSIPDSSAVPNATHDTGSEFGAGHEGKILEIAVDNSYTTVCTIVKHVHFYILFYEAVFCSMWLC